jgi:hypothetical protein
MKRTVLPNVALPTRLPVQTTALVYLLLHHFTAPEWVCGVVWTLMAVRWLGAVYMLLSEVTKPLNGYGEMK